MSVLCQGISGYARVYLYPLYILVHKNRFWRVCRMYVLVCPWYVRVCPGMPGCIFTRTKLILAGIPEVCLSISVARPGMLGYVRAYSYP
jgi:hypothetical protein